MSILEKLRKDKVQAMKDKDKLRIGVISLMMSSIALAEKEKKKTLEDEEALEFIKRELKQTKDALEQTPTNREDLISETEKKIEIISSYLPEQMSIEELKKEVEKIIKELNLEKKLGLDRTTRLHLARRYRSLYRTYAFRLDCFGCR